MDNEPLLVVRDAVKTFTIRQRSLRQARMVAVDGVSLTVGRGETVGLVGESGSGKSTLGRAILHLLSLDSGQIVFEDQEIQNLNEREFRPLRRRLQMVFQNPLTSFNPTMTIGQTLVDAMRLAGSLSPAEKRQRAIELLDQVQLDAQFAMHYPYEMSGGQLQRVALARALAPGPEFIFLDEPTAALDMSIRGQIVNLLIELQRKTQLSFIFVSHDLRVIRYVAHRMYVMYLGQVVETGDKRQIFEFPYHPYTRALLAATRLDRKNRDRIERVGALRGEAVLAAGDSAGCKLYGRCPYAQERCAHEPQVLQEIQPNHWVRCWQAETLARTTWQESTWAAGGRSK